GDTFVNVARGNIPSHLWFVVSNPTGANRIAIVNISTDPGGLSGLETLRPADHSWIDRESYIRTDKAVLASIPDIRAAFTANPPLLIAKRKASAATVTKLQQVLHGSRYTRREVRLALREQGFIPS